MNEFLNSYELGDMKAVYHIERETGKTGMYLLPTSGRDFAWEDKNQKMDSLLQVKLMGDAYLGSYAGGVTLREGGSVDNLKYDSQIKEEDNEKVIIKTILKDERGYEAIHNLVWYKSDESVEMYSEIKNNSSEGITLEMLSSFSLGGLSPYLKGDGCGCLWLHRIRSVWSMEGRLESIPVEDLQLEPSWTGHAIRCERFGQAGSMPVNRFFPFAAIEDRANGVIWGAQIAHNASWQMEVYRKEDGLALSGGLADRDLGHWMKKVNAGESFETPRAIVSVCKGDINMLTQRLTKAGMKHFLKAPKSEQTLPVLFNEYCTTWGDPSHKNITEILNAIKDKGFSYFVIDCGWYRQDGIPWDVAMGDYEISKELFPDGLDKTVKAINDAGMKAGIWFEIDNVGCKSKAYQMEDRLLKINGKVLTTTSRRFFNMTDPLVQDYLKERVTGLLKKYGFEYIKMDYNDSIGIGCDNEDSLGEGLRQNMMASADFIRSMKRDIPDLLVENCSSGGHKLEPLMMSLSSMASFSDAHECPEIPVIAANLHRTILPCQSQIWCVIRKTDSLKRIAYSVAATFLGRMCISGDVTNLDSSQWDVLDKGIAFYKKIAPVIKDGFTRFYGEPQFSFRHLLGWQGVLRSNDEGKAYFVFHKFTDDGTDVSIELPKAYRIADVYSDSECDVSMMGNTLSINGIREEMRAVALYLE